MASRPQLFALALAAVGFASVVPGTVDAQLYLGQWGSPGSGSGQFNHPYDAATDAAGDVYVTDHFNHRIHKFSATGTLLTQWGVQGNGNGQFNYPNGVATDAAGNVYVVDQNNHRVQKFTGTGTYLTQWGSLGSGNGQFYFPVRVALDPAGDVYVTDTQNRRVQKFTSAGTYITQWGSLGTGNGQFEGITGVATNAVGEVYVADPANGRIQKFTGTGTYLSQFGSLGSGNGQFSTAYGVAIDAAGTIYVSDAGNDRIQRFTGAGVYLGQWGSSGNANGQFNYPSGVTTDAAGNAYVVDHLNDRIQKFSLVDGAPHAVACFSLDNDRVLVTYDVDVTAATATDPANYSLESTSQVLAAAMVHPHQTMLTVSSLVSPGDLETLTISGIMADSTGVVMMVPEEHTFFSGLVTPSMIQAPSPTALAGAPCVDRSRFAGPDSLPGPLVTVLATCVGNYDLFARAVLSDTSGSVDRGGVFVECPFVPLSYGTVYRVTGRVSELNGNTTLGLLLYADSLYVTPEPMTRFSVTPPSAAVLAGGSCDATQSQVTGEDYEGRLVRLPDSVVRRGDPFNDTFVVSPTTSPGDSIGVVMLNRGGHYPYDEGTRLNLAGMVVQRGEQFAIAPRDLGDLELLDPDFAFHGLDHWIFGPGQASIVGSAPSDTLVIVGMAGDGRDGLSIHLPDGAQSWATRLDVTPTSPMAPSESISVWTNYVANKGDPNIRMLTNGRESVDISQIVSTGIVSATDDQEADNEDVAEKTDKVALARKKKGKSQLQPSLDGAPSAPDTVVWDRDSIAHVTSEAGRGFSPVFDFVRISVENRKPVIELMWPQDVILTLVRNANAQAVPADRLTTSELTGPNQIVALTDITVFLWRASAIRLSGMTSGSMNVAVDGARPARGSITASQNPFHAGARLGFAIDRAGPVAITLYDVRGRRLRRWNYEALPAGEHSLRWDGQTDDGRSSPRGIVFARIVVGGGAWATKFVYVE